MNNTAYSYGYIHEHIVWIKHVIDGKTVYSPTLCNTPEDYSKLVEAEFMLDKIPPNRRWVWNPRVKRFADSFPRLNLFTDNDARRMASLLVNNGVAREALQMLEDDK